MTDAKLVRLAAVLVVFAGYAFVFRAGETRIAAQAAENARAAQQLADAERALASRAALERNRTQLRAELRAADLTGERGALVARFLRDASVLAAARHCAIVAVAASGAAPAPAAPSPATAEPFETIALETTVEGRYPGVLATIRSLSARAVPAAVEVASLARKDATADATVTAVLRVTLQRLAPLATAETANARAR